MQSLSKEHFSQWGALTVATRENSDRAGREGRAERKEIQKRADVKLAPETYVMLDRLSEDMERTVQAVRTVRIVRPHT